MSQVARRRVSHRITVGDGPGSKRHLRGDGMIMTGNRCRTGLRNRFCGGAAAAVSRDAPHGEDAGAFAHLFGEPDTAAQMPQHGHGGSSGLLLSRRSDRHHRPASATSASAPTGSHPLNPVAESGSAGGGRRMRSASIRDFSAVRVGAFQQQCWGSPNRRRGDGLARRRSVVLIFALPANLGK